MIDDLTRDEVAARLSGEGRADLVRAGAEAGVAEAQAVWGQMCLDRGDAPSGFVWFMKAAAQEHLTALNMVGRCYDLGWGVAIDKARAAECYRVAAERGLDWGMYNYATLRALGEGVPQDRTVALDWFERAAALGNAKALNFCGSFAEDGWVRPKDMAKAADLYRRAAEGGDFRGCFNHARMLLADGDERGARAWIARAVELGNDRFRAQVRAWIAREASALIEAALC